MEVIGAVCVLVYVTTSAALFRRYVTLPFEAWGGLVELAPVGRSN